MTTERDAYRAQEDEALGQAMAECFQRLTAFFALGDTMASLQRSLYKHTDAGIAISFELHDGSFVYVGDEQGPERLIEDFDAMCKSVNDEACALWDEANGDEEEC